MKPIPQQLYDRAELLARSHPMGAVSLILGVCRPTLSLMKKRGWRAVDYSASRRPVPGDFVIQAKGMTHGELMTHYRAASRTIARWMRERRPRPPMKKPGRPRGSK
jgi:hypothetical protein